MKQREKTKEVPTESVKDKKEPTVKCNPKGGGNNGKRHGYNPNWH